MRQDIFYNGDISGYPVCFGQDLQRIRAMVQHSEEETEIKALIVVGEPGSIPNNWGGNPLRKPPLVI